MSSLKPMEIKTSDEASDAENKTMKLLWRYRYFGAALVPIILFLAASDGGVGIAQKSDKVCREECDARRNQRCAFFKGGDILNPKDLVKLVTDEKENLVENLKVDYGEENFLKMFMNEDGTVRPFVPYSDKSLARLKRKLMIKVLSAQTKLMQKEMLFDGCDCINGDVGIQGDAGAELKKNGADDEDDSSPPLDTSFENYIWVTGGHSASAGHGNLYNESYTAFMERDVKDVFGSIGIDFQARNYAMGGTGSAAEMAMCWSEIFGDDVDFFSWDYGMTDAGKPLRLLHYAYRGVLSGGRPAFMAINAHLDTDGAEVLDDSGVSMFIEDRSQWSKMRKAIPDTLGLSTDEINAMPEYVRNYKCDGVIEKGDPFCLIEKYSREICEDRQGKAPWHPGIKTHAMVGHSLALFLVDSLLSALKDLTKLKSEGLEELLSRLVREETELFDDHIVKADFEKVAKALYAFESDNNDEINLDPSLFFSGKSMCHTARLPSRTRYLGYLTDTDKVGGPVPFGKETYEVGVEMKEATTKPDTMQLVWDDDKMHQDDCPFAVSIDYKDSFLSNGDGWNSLNIPNGAERKAYDYNPAELEGIVVVVLTSCDWDNCAKGYLRPADFGEKWEMRINGITVKGLVSIGNKSLVVQGEKGIKFPASSDNDYKIEIKVNEEGSYVKISSFIIH